MLVQGWRILRARLEHRTSTSQKLVTCVVVLPNYCVVRSAVVGSDEEEIAFVSRMQRVVAGQTPREIKSFGERKSSTRKVAE